MWLSVPFQLCDDIIQVLKEKKIRHSYGSPGDINYKVTDNNEAAFLVIIIRPPENIKKLEILEYIWGKYNKKCLKNKTTNKWYSCNGKEEENIKSTNVFVKNFECYEKDEKEVKDYYRIVIRNNSFIMNYKEKRFYIIKE